MAEHLPFAHPTPRSFLTRTAKAMAMLVFPDTPPCLGHLCMGVGKPGLPTLPSCGSPGHPAGSPRSALVRAVPPRQLQPPKSSLPAWSADMGHGCYREISCPQSLSHFLRLWEADGSGLVVFGWGWKTHPSQTDFLLQVVWGFFSPSSFCAVLSVLYNRTYLLHYRW